MDASGSPPPRHTSATRSQPFSAGLTVKDPCHPLTTVTVAPITRRGRAALFVLNFLPYP